MTYSLVSPSAIGFDLVRRPGGVRVAEVLRVAIAAGPAELDALASRHRGVPRPDQWYEATLAAAPRTLGTALIADATAAFERALEGDREGSETLLAHIERDPVGDTFALERLVRHDVLDWTWSRAGQASWQAPVAQRAADVLVDAALSAYASAVLDDRTRRLMSSPYVAARLSPPAVASSPAAALLAGVTVVDAPGRQRWRRAVADRVGGTTGWAEAMHAATWALHLSGRLRHAADAQLQAVAAFDAAGFTARDAAHGVWNALSGAVHAALAADLVPDDTARRLRAVADAALPDA